MRTASFGRNSCRVVDIQWRSPDVRSFLRAARGAGAKLPRVQVRSLMRRTFRASKLVATDRRIPKPLRWLAALALLPVPGPFDEAVLLVLVPILLIFHCEPMREAWRATHPRGDHAPESIR